MKIDENTVWGDIDPSMKFLDHPAFPKKPKLSVMGYNKDDIPGGDIPVSKKLNPDDEGYITPEDKEPKQEVENYEEYTELVEIYLDNLTFDKAFEIEHRAKGEGHTFWWNGEEYTTDLYISTGNYQWVRNSDDADDNCRTNEFDECGICNGTGKITWYIDLDGDGLGDPTNYTKSCIYPSVDEE